MHCVLTLSCPTFCNPVDRGPSSVHGILQARILEWVAVSLSRRSSQPRGRTDVSCISCTGRLILYHWVTWQLHRCIYWSSHQPTYLRYVHFIINYILIFYLKKEYYWKWMNNIFFTKKKKPFLNLIVSDSILWRPLSPIPSVYYLCIDSSRPSSFSFSLTYLCPPVLPMALRVHCLSLESLSWIPHYFCPALQLAKQYPTLNYSTCSTPTPTQLNMVGKKPHN